jgi:hypothetical protein
LNKVFKAICDKTRKTEQEITERAIRYRIKTFQKKSNIATKELAENVYAYQMEINLENLLSSDSLKELQDWLSKKPIQPIHDLGHKTKRSAVTSKVYKKIIDGFGLPLNLTNEANKMADIYPDLYHLENLIRYVVMSVLEKKYGNDWWENRNVVSKTIAEKVEERRHFEGINRWVTKRGKQNIFYTDFRDLSRIIAQNSVIFKAIFADMEIEAELRKLEPLRNIIAHNNPLSPKEIGRIKTALDDLQIQLKDYNEK